MSIKVTKNTNSITVVNGENRINVVVNNTSNTGFDFYESLAGREAGAARNAMNEIRAILVNKMNKKNNYQNRVSKLATAIENMGSLESFSVFYNRLKKLVFA
jgi:hypothetical protein